MTPAAAGRPEGAYRRIVVGHDGSPRGDDALALGRGLRELTGAELIVAGVIRYEAFIDAPIAASQPPARELREQRVKDVRADLEFATRATEARVEVVASSSAPRGLHQVAEEVEADLVVVGSSHRGRLGRLFVGSVSERVSHGAPCAVAVAPLGFAARAGVSFRTIGVGFDGKPEARLALREAARFSESVGAALKVFAVTPFTPYENGWNLRLDVIDVAEHDRLKEELDAALAALPEAAHAEGVLLTGRPAVTLADQEVDLLVVGSRGYGPLRRVMLGGVSVALLRVASSPVLVFPRGASVEHGADPDRARAAAE